MTKTKKIKAGERLADLCHRQWSGWMEYLFSKGTFNDDGTWTMPAWAVERWQRQMNTAYDDLSEQEKDSDRKEAERFIQVLDEASREKTVFFDYFPGHLFDSA